MALHLGGSSLCFALLDRIWRSDGGCRFAQVYALLKLFGLV